MKASVSYVQTTKNPNWVIVHCISNDGKVAIALCKSGVMCDQLVDIHKSFKDGKYTNFATVIEG